MSTSDSNRKLHKRDSSSGSSNARGNQGTLSDSPTFSPATHYLQAAPVVQFSSPPYGYYPMPLDLSGQMFQQPLAQGWIQYQPYTVSPGIPAVIIPQHAVMYNGGTDPNQHHQAQQFHQSPHHRSLPNLRYPDTAQVPFNGLAPILSRSDEDEDGAGIKKSPDQAVSTPALDSTDFKRAVNHAIETKRNVYVRGLPPYMNDALLMDVCAPFGQVISAKAILEQQPLKTSTGELMTATGPCKGYGFVMFASEDEAQVAINELNKAGYQASFAKESFSAKLKTMQDAENTNIYITNLPFSVDEPFLESLFAPFGDIQSSIVLREKHTKQSRGVGFVRMATRQAAEQAIEKLNATFLPGSLMPLLVRFSDNPEQKRLKSGSSSRRHTFLQSVGFPHYRTPSDPSGLSFVASPGIYAANPVPDRSLAVVSHTNASKSGHSASSNTVTNSNSTINSTSIPGLTQSPISDSNSFRSRSIDITGHGGTESRRGSGFGLLRDENGERRSPHARASITARRHSETSTTSSSRRASVDNSTPPGGGTSLSPSKHSLGTRSGDMNLLLDEMNELEVSDETAPANKQ